MAVASARASRPLRERAAIDGMMIFYHRSIDKDALAAR
jgi:hypothetical protein